MTAPPVKTAQTRWPGLFFTEKIRFGIHLQSCLKEVKDPPCGESFGGVVMKKMFVIKGIHSL